MKDPKPKFTATMTLPKDGMQSWSDLMSGESDTPSEINIGSPIVMATALFEDGTSVLGGVLKSGDSDYNIKFMWAFDKQGKQYPAWPIDTSDHEDFFATAYAFSITDSEEDLYLLKIIEAN